MATILPRGDIPNPNAWQDALGAIPPAPYQNMPAGTNFPNNGDGRYWFSVNAFAPTLAVDPITFIGDPAYLIAGPIGLQWSITAIANDGSALVLSYSLDGATFVTTTISPATQMKGIISGIVKISAAAMAAATSFRVKVESTGGASSSLATKSTVAVAITRNTNESIPWDGQPMDPLDPINYNCDRLDFSGFPSQQLQTLQSRMMIRLGFANQAANPPPGMAALTAEFLQSAQTFLYRRYTALQTRRFFRWKVNPGQRFYSLKDNDEDVLGKFLMDPAKTVEWAGIQDTRNVWYPLIKGIPPQLYTMIAKPWRPARYDIRQCLEVYPMPDQTYFLWIRANFGLLSFVNPTDTTTLDSELVFLQALANAKAHYGQPDANNIMAEANAYRGELVAGTHQTAHYIPGTIAVPPAVRPTLITFSQ